MLAQRCPLAADVGRAAALGRARPGRVAGGAPAAVAARRGSRRAPPSCCRCGTRGRGPLRSAPGPMSRSLPRETRAGLVLFLDFVFLFFVVVQRIEGLEDVERLLRWCALAAVGMAPVGHRATAHQQRQVPLVLSAPVLAHLRRGEGEFRQSQSFRPISGLGNRSPAVVAARRVAPGAGGAADRLPAADRRGDERKIYLLGLALGIVLFAALLSLSRGGIAALFIAATVCAALCYWASSFSGRLLAVVAAVGLLIGASLGIFGFDRVSNRLEDFSSGSLERLDQSCRATDHLGRGRQGRPASFSAGNGRGKLFPRLSLVYRCRPRRGLCVYARRELLSANCPGNGLPRPGPDAGRNRPLRVVVRAYGVRPSQRGG